MLDIYCEYIFIMFMYMSTSDGSSKTLDIVVQHQQMLGRVAHATNMIGMYYSDTFMNKSSRREPEEADHDLVMRSLNNRKAYYTMFRMPQTVFDCAQETLVDNLS
jgi:hypothetical protein